MAEENKNARNAEESMPGPSEDSLSMPDLAESEALRAKLAELEVAAAQFKDQFLRKAADFDNYKRRVENDYTSMVKFSNEELITRLIPILDDIERSLRAVTPAQPSGSDDGSPDKAGSSDAGFVRGIELIHAKFRKLLESHGVKEMEAVGKPFDPMLHDALLQMPRKDVAPHTVVEEVEKGYMLHDKVIRHARVIVSADVPSGDGVEREAGN